MAYNEAHGTTPHAVGGITQGMNPLAGLSKAAEEEQKQYEVKQIFEAVRKPIIEAMSEKELRKSIDDTHRRMRQAAKDLDFREAAALRDEAALMQARLDNMNEKA